MRCPKCGIELNTRSERCPRCGTPARLAKPDGDAMSRVRRQIAVVSGKTPPPDRDYSDASFSPVMKFEKEETGVIEDNPADNFQDEIFTPVDIDSLLEKHSETEAEIKHRGISAEIRRMVKNKDDDLLAEYYFKDGISDLEKYQIAKSFRDSERAESDLGPQEDDKAEQKEPSPQEVMPDDEAPKEEEMSEAARRLSTFPEESGIDKALTLIGEKYDSAALGVKNFFHKLIYVRIKRLYDRLDGKTAPFLNKLLDKFYYKKAGKLKLKRSEGDAERRRARRVIWSVCGVAVMLLMCAVIFAASLFTDGITGEWIVSYDMSGKPSVIMEFTPGGSAVVSVKSEDGWHVHKQGKYNTRRKNGHDMLTITYEDGTVSRLYYVINGRSGTFINVETNAEVVYDLK